MRIALISDIHGNLVALEAALAAIAEAGADQIVCLGDVAALGPQPREVIDSLRARGIPVVMGNTDAWLLDPQPHPYRDEDTQRVYEVESWCAQQLSATDLEFIRTFRPIVEIPLDTGASLLCFHGSPRSNTEIILSTTPPDELDGMLTGYNAALMAGGHTHTQMFRRHAQTALVNPGSVGLPFVRDAQGNVAYNPPGRSTRSSNGRAAA